MGSDGVPDWMKSRIRREPPVRRDTARVPVAVLLVLTGALVALSIYVREEYTFGFHLPVIAANATLLAAVGLSRVHFSDKSGGAFVLLAVPVNVLTLAGAALDNDTSSLIAFMSTLLGTGLIGLILLSRTEKSVSKMTKVTVTGFLLQMTVIGPVLYLAGLETVFVMASLPMMLLTLTAFLLFSAYHSSETTLPSDRWV